MIRVETETKTPFKVDASGAVTNQLETAPVSTMTHYFNIANDDHLGGIEVDGATTVLVGPNWAYGAAQTDVNKLALTPADMSALPAEFVEYVLDPSDSAGAQTFEVKVTVDSGKFVFAKVAGFAVNSGAWDPSVDGINELDTYVFDTSDPSMKGYMLGFSTAKDNAGADAKALITAAEGVTVSAADPGETGAATTLVLPAGYGGVDGENITELHIYGAEQDTGPVTVDKVNFDEASGTFEILPTSPGAFTGMPFYDWSKFELVTGGNSSETLTLDTLLATGEAGGQNIVDGKLVVKIDASKIASLAASLGDTDADTVNIKDGFNHATSGVDVVLAPGIAVDLGSSSTVYPPTYTDKVGMGTDATDGVAVTDMLRDIQSSVSTEGAMEKTTYILNGQVVGYSETEAMMATDPGGYTPPAGGYTPPAGGTSSNIQLYDANDEWVGSYNKQGDGSYNLNLTVKTNADVDLNSDGTANFGDSAAADKEYFVEIMKNAYMMMEGTTSTLQENETVNYYKVATVNGEEQADMSASGKLGSEQTFDGVTSIYDGNGASLGQKSSVDFTDASAAAAAGIREVADAEFAELPASFKAASGKTYVREETFGDAMQQSTEATYMDDKGKALGYAYGNSDTYTDPVTQKTVTNSNLNFQSAEREPLGSIRMDGMGETRKVIEFIDNQNGDKKVDIDSDSTTGDGDGNEITLLGVIRVETETETPFKVDASGAVTNQLETAPVSTMTHYF